VNSWITNARRSDIRKRFIKSLKRLPFILVLIFFDSRSLNAIEIDLSNRSINSIEKKNFGQEGVLEQMLTSIADQVQPIVILNMEKEFVPNTVRLKRNGNYRFYVANVNEKNKNVAFVLDAFNQNHGTYFGQVKVFDVKPKVNGLFTFNCPETGIQGKIVVISDENTEETVGAR
jgi:hypothetical protein